MVVTAVIATGVVVAIYREFQHANKATRSIEHLRMLLEDVQYAVVERISTGNRSELIEGEDLIALKKSLSSLHSGDRRPWYESPGPPSTWFVDLYSGDPNIHNPTVTIEYFIDRMPIRLRTSGDDVLFDSREFHKIVAPYGIGL
jgi:hypothetical protein